MTAPAASRISIALSGKSCWTKQKYPDAEKEFRTALHLDPHNRDSAIGLASSLDLQKRYSGGIPILELLAKAPDAPRLIRSLSWPRVTIT